MYPGADGEFTLYDDGISQAYLRGKGTWTRFTWSDRARRLTMAPHAPPCAASKASAASFESS